MNSSIQSAPFCTVVIPVRNDATNLRACLEALRQSEFDDYDIIIVDDASTDDTADVAESLADHVIRLDKQMGPAGARNLGVKEAKGEYVVFVDADVEVSPQSLAQFAETFKSDEAIDAIFGSYDLQPRAGNLISQYKNLFHHFIHQQSNEDACSFWTGCGAIKRQVFLDMGGFDTDYSRPCIEDIELGARLVSKDHKIRLNKSIQATHRKRWTFWNLVKTDVFDRAIPWTRLMCRQQNIPNDLNLSFPQRFCAILSAAFIVIFAVGAWYYSQIILAVAVALGGFLGLLILDRCTMNHRVPDFVRIIAVLATVVLLGISIYEYHLWAISAISCLLGIVAVNRQFYRFFWRERNPLFAVVVVPLHVCYYLYGSFGFVVGNAIHHIGRLTGTRPAPSADPVEPTPKFDSGINGRMSETTPREPPRERNVAPRTTERSF